MTSPYSQVEGRQACHVAHVHAATGASGRAAGARAGLRVRPHEPHALHQCKWCCGGSAELLCMVQVFDITVQACDCTVQQLAGASPASQRAQRLCDACCYVMNAAYNTCKPLLAWSACSKLNALLAQTPTASPSLAAPVLGTARAVALLQPLPPALAQHPPLPAWGLRPAADVEFAEQHEHDGQVAAQARHVQWRVAIAVGRVG